MDAFVASNGETLTLVRTLTVRKVITEEPQVQPPPPPPTRVTGPPPNETPKERMLRLKREKSEQEAEKLKAAARGAIKDYEIGRQRKQENLYSTGQAKAPSQKPTADPYAMSNSGTTIANLSISRLPADRTLEFEQSLVQQIQKDYNTEANYYEYLRSSHE